MEEVQQGSAAGFGISGRRVYAASLGIPAFMFLFYFMSASGNLLAALMSFFASFFELGRVGPGFGWEQAMKSVLFGSVLLVVAMYPLRKGARPWMRVLGFSAWVVYLLENFFLVVAGC